MKILGDPLFAKNADGSLKSRIGTLFFRTPGLVTQRGVHAMQRIAWTKELSRLRVEAGRPELSDEERQAEWSDSADLLFSGDTILIRPDPNHVELAFKADEVLQTLVSKRQIRFLNTHAAAVRDALRARGENWRMARPAQTPEEIDRSIASAHVAISHEQIYYYNARTGTRFLTAGGFASIAALDAKAFRAQMKEIVRGLVSRNRLGQPEIALFPTALDPAVAASFRELSVDILDDAQLRSAFSDIGMKWRLALPDALREERVDNLTWRNEMSATLAREPNETNIGDQDLIQGISPEFYRQVEWLPGARMEDGQLIFDPLYDEAQRTQDPELLHLCDARVRAIVFNSLRILGSIEYINVGRIAHSLARHPNPGERRGSVYLVQCKLEDEDRIRIFMLRFQKWDVAEHLDEGKTLLQAIVEANEYSDYIMDRRLACRQLGMNLPPNVGVSQLTEKYQGRNQYNGTTVRSYYYARSYVQGTASDKIPVERFRNPAFAIAFAALMGEAAALDLIVGRAATETGECVFDQVYEVIQYSPDGLPRQIRITDHAGSFVKYQESFEELVTAYAHPIVRRKQYVANYATFAKVYVQCFERKLAEVQQKYRARRRAFDELFYHRPYDQAGSGAFRWNCALKRLDACDPKAVAAKLAEAIGE